MSDTKRKSAKVGHKEKNSKSRIQRAELVEVEPAGVTLLHCSLAGFKQLQVLHQTSTKPTQLIVLFNRDLRTMDVTKNLGRKF